MSAPTDAEKAAKAAEKEARRLAFASHNPQLVEKDAAKKQQKQQPKESSPAAAAAAVASAPAPAPAPAPTAPAPAATAPPAPAAADADAKAAAAAEKEARRKAFAAQNPQLADKDAAKKKPQQQSAPAAAAATQPSATAAPAAASPVAPAPAASAPASPVKTPAWAEQEPLAQLRQAAAMMPGFAGAAPPSVASALPPGESTQSTHPRVAALGALLVSRCIVGGNARLLATLDALRIAACGYVESHAVSGGMRVLQNLSAYLRYNIKHLEACRPFTSGMKQVTDRIMRNLGDLSNAGDLTARSIDAMIQGLRDELLEAVAYTASGAASVVQEGDIVVTYGRSSAIELALCSLCERNSAIAEANRLQLKKAAAAAAAAVSTASTTNGTTTTTVVAVPPPTRKLLQFSVVIVDSAPLFEGRALLKKLREAGAPSVTYCMLDACVMAVHRATKVFLGASALMPNGQVLGRAGTAMVALAARYCRKPVFAVCESYKFTAHMWQGSLTANGSHQHDPAFRRRQQMLQQQQHGAASFLGGGAAPYAGTGGMGSADGDWSSAAPSALNNNTLLYDLTAPGTVNFVVSEHEVHEPTAIAAVVRMQQA